MSVLDRVAAAPISWGVCEAPGWGLELPAQRVLGEMRELGLTATELGPAGYLGRNPSEVKASLSTGQLALVAGFVPVTLHAGVRADLTEADAAIRILAEAGAQVVVLAARSADGSYDHKVHLTDRQWSDLLANLDRSRELAAEHGLLAVVHPHVGTAIESRETVLRLVEDSDVPLCLDTGHLLIGGLSPAELLDLAADRIAHVHLKDVRADLADAVGQARMSYLEAIRAGQYVPLGQGDADIAGVVKTLEGIGYSGWYVLEQDCSLEVAPGPGTGPIEDVRDSLAYLAAVTG